MLWIPSTSLLLDFSSHTTIFKNPVQVGDANGDSNYTQNILKFFHCQNLNYTKVTSGLSEPIHATKVLLHIFTATKAANKCCSSSGYSHPPPNVFLPFWLLQNLSSLHSAYLFAQCIVDDK